MSKSRKKYVKRTKAAEKAVCTMLAMGLIPKRIAERPGMPSERQIYSWAAEIDSPFSREYARARAIGYTRLADEIIEISDDGSNDWMKAKGGYVVNREATERSKLRVDTRKWLLSKCLPKMFGDKLDVSAKHEAGDSFKQIWTALAQGHAMVAA